MTSIGESEMRRRRKFAEYIASGPQQWQESTRDAIINGAAPMDGYKPMLEKPWREPRVWPVALIIGLIFLVFLIIATKSAHAQVRGSSTQTASGIGCNSVAVYDASTSGSTQLVAAGTNGEAIYVCGYTFFSAGTVNVELDYGTGSACATGTKKIVPAYEFTAQTGISDQSPIFRGLAAPSGNALCIKISGSVAVQAIVYFAQF
jgi:hypothetical protein